MTTDLALPGAISETALDLPADLTFAEWQATGQTLGRISRACQWWLGDWLNYGERAYGEKYTEAIEVTGYELGTLKNFAWVAAHVETSRRRDVLSYSHHQEVAQFNPPNQDRWLTAAEANGWSAGKLRIEIRKTGEVPAERECCPTCKRPLPKRN